MMDWPAQVYLIIFVGGIFFLFGLYSLIKGVMHFDPQDGVERLPVKGLKARMLGGLVMVLGILISVVGVLEFS
jgi:c-di-GMP-related signal transduction protein